jgi:hypothetical protein
MNKDKRDRQNQMDDFSALLMVGLRQEMASAFVGAAFVKRMSDREWGREARDEASAD